MPLHAYNGSSWVDAKNVEVWTGSSWADAKTVKVWNGSAWELAWPLRSTVSITGDTFSLTSDSGHTGTGSTKVIANSTFTISLSNWTSVKQVDIEFTPWVDPIVWTNRGRWTAGGTGGYASIPGPSWSYSFSPTVFDGHRGNWSVRVMITHTDDFVVESAHHVVEVKKKTLTLTGPATPEVGTSHTWSAACVGAPTSDCPGGQVPSAGGHYTGIHYANGGGWNYLGPNGTSWTSGSTGMNGHWFMYQEVWPNGSRINTPIVTVQPTVTPDPGIPVSEPNTVIGITTSERYSMGGVTSTRTQYEPIYLSTACGAYQVVEWVYRINGGPWAAYTRKSRGSANPDDGYGNYAKTCLYLNTVGSYEFRARWGTLTSQSAFVTVSASGNATWNSLMVDVNNRINAAEALYNREYGTITGEGANDGDTTDWTPTSPLPYQLMDDTGAVIGPGINYQINNRFLGVQAPEFKEDGTKSWQWGKSAWRRTTEHIPRGRNVGVLMKSAYPSGVGFDSSRGDGNFRTCRSVYVTDLNSDLCEVLVEEGLAKSYTQRSSTNGVAQHAVHYEAERRGNSNLARAERASYAGLALYRANASSEPGKWGISFDNNYIYIYNYSGSTRDISKWWVADAAGVSNNQQIGSAGSSVPNGGRVDIYIKGMDNSPKIETAWLHTNKTSNGGEPDEVVCWARRLEGGGSVVQVPMNIAR